MAEKKKRKMWFDGDLQVFPECKHGVDVKVVQDNIIIGNVFFPFKEGEKFTCTNIPGGPYTVVSVERNVVTVGKAVVI